MALFDKKKKKLAQTGQSAVKKTKDMAEVAKINSMISDEEKSINNNYYQIGKLYVSMHGNDCEDDFKGMLESIRQSEKKIVEYKEQVQLIKGVVRCEKCGGEVSINSAFCNSCGAPMPKRVPVQTYDEDTIKCDKCGKYVKKGMRFCTSCGNPMPQDEEKTGVESGEQQLQSYKKCPNCGYTSNDSEVFFCNNCGTKMIDVQNDSNDLATPEKVVQTFEKTKTCPNCGFETADESIDFCTECGTKLILK